MSRVPAETSRVSILLLTEDGSDEAHDVLAALTERMLRLIDPSADLRKIHFEPASPEARRAAAGYGWLSKKPRDHYKMVDLRQAILTKLGRGNGFVVVHLDGDMTWDQSRSGEEHKNRPEFQRVILAGVLQFLAKQGKQAQASRILYLSPYYHIEAWLFQNSEELARIYAERPTASAHDLELLKEWKKNPSLLDDVWNIKKALQIENKHNLRLATQSFPAAKARDVGKSFARAVADLEASSELCAALAAARYG